MLCYLGVSILIPRLTSTGNPIVQIRLSYDRPIATMGFPILVRRHFYIDRGPGCALLNNTSYLRQAVGVFLEIDHITTTPLSSLIHIQTMAFFLNHSCVKSPLENRKFYMFIISQHRFSGCSRNEQKKNNKIIFDKLYLIPHIIMPKYLKVYFHHFFWGVGWGVGRNIWGCML